MPKRVTNSMVVEALVARFRKAGVPLPHPDKITGWDLNEAYGDAREAAGNPMRLVNVDRPRGAGPKKFGLPESRDDEVMRLYTEVWEAGKKG